eukprot:TRINITY_DN89249_c0_g2_i2.p1 TRINITY_DN89249_c0_g2~~TRINITY_DN89249_c0_g2_i2.p1  ORF type:complete len:228 (+),score=8.16 TRINITY_DN89249_c0_g2_i2:39-686(+)
MQTESSWWRGQHIDTAAMEDYAKRGVITVADYFEDVVDSLRGPVSPHCLECVATGKVWSYRDVESLANRIARWWCIGCREPRLMSGDVVALMMENRPEFIAIWLAFSKIGVIVALINTQLRGGLLQDAVELAQNPWSLHVLWLLVLRSSRGDCVGLRMNSQTMSRHFHLTAIRNIGGKGHCTAKAMTQFSIFSLPGLLGGQRLLYLATLGLLQPA